MLFNSGACLGRAFPKLDVNSMLRLVACRAAPRRLVRHLSTTTNETENLYVTPDEIKSSKLLISTRDCVEGREIIEEIGIVSATVVRTKNIVEDIFAALGGVFGGETRSYSVLMNETTQEAVHRLKGAAIAQGATAVVMTKFEINTTMNRFIFGLHSTVLVYGTAVVCRPVSNDSK
ncbi:unnamed protein product [Aphanomyces euteiches]|nr:hypothetical protein AeRB84_002596 [Aphanomyces euteiches]